MPVTPPPSAGGGGGSVVFYDEGSAVGTGTILNFVGAGVTGTFSNGTATATISGGTAAGSIVVREEGTAVGTATDINFVGSATTATFSGGTATITTTASGGWTLSIDEDGSSFANWTARDGTWASTSGEIRQTNTGASEYHAQYTAALSPMGIVVAQCEVWIPSANSTDDYIGMDIGMSSNNASASGARLYLRRTGTSKLVGTVQSGTETPSATVTVNTDTWYTIKAMVVGGRISGWLDGTLLFTGTAIATTATDATYFGLFTALSTGHFRNIKVWTMTLPS